MLNHGSNMLIPVSCIFNDVNNLLKGVIGCKIHFYMLFEHKCVLAVCVHNHPIMIKIHPVFFGLFFNPDKWKPLSQIKLISDFWLCDVTRTQAPPTNADWHWCFSTDSTRMAPKRLRCFVVGSNEHSSRHLLLTSELLKMWRITFVFEGNARHSHTT